MPTVLNIDSTVGAACQTDSAEILKVAITIGEAGAGRTNSRSNTSVGLTPEQANFTNTKVALVYIVGELVELVAKLEGVSTRKVIHQVTGIRFERLADRNILNRLGNVRRAVEPGSARVSCRHANWAAAVETADAWSYRNAIRAIFFVQIVATEAPADDKL